MREHRLRDLVAHPVHRMQARERVLEDHRDVPAPDLPELGRVQLEQVAALEEDLAGHVGVGAVEEAHDREARDALARSRLADDAERLAAADAEREVRDGLDDPVPRAEADGEVPDVEESGAADGAGTASPVRTQVTTCT